MSEVSDGWNLGPLFIASYYSLLLISKTATSLTKLVKTTLKDS